MIGTMGSGAYGFAGTAVCATHSAVLAELPAAAFLPARRAHARSLVAVVDAPGPVLALDFLVQLIDLRRGLHAGYLLVEPGSAGRAQPPLVIPARLSADPLPAAMALVEVRFHLLDRLGERLVTGRPAHAVTHPLGIPADLLGPLTDRAADQITTEPEQPAPEPLPYLTGGTLAVQGDIVR